VIRPAILALSLLVATAANAATRYTSTIEFPDQTRTETATMLVDSGRLRIDTRAGGEMTVIFDSDTQAMTLVDHAARTYMVLDRATVEELAGQLSQAMKQMEQALEAMPEAQRQQMRRMMEQQLGQLSGGEPLAVPEVSDLGSTGTVGGLSCSWKAIRRAGALESKVCVGDWRDMPGGDEMLAVQNEMRAFAGSLQEAFTSGGPSILSQAFRQDAFEAVTLVGGFPLISERYQGTTMTERTTFTGSDDVAVSDADFAPPAGFKMQSMAPGGPPTRRPPGR
jgi:hypothetical protein